MGQYAKETSVPVERSKQEIERTLARYGASEFVYGSKQDRAMVGFVLENRRIRFLLPLPNPKDEKYLRTDGGRQRRPGKHTSELAQRAWEQDCRQRWRALALTIKAKLEAVEVGIATIDEEFLGYMILPNGSTMSEWAAPQLTKFYEKGSMPPLLPSGGP